MTEIGTAFISILPEMRNMSSHLSKGMTGPASTAGKTAGSRFGKVFGTSAMTPMKGLVAGIGGLFAAQKVVGFFKDSIAEAREAQVTTARTNSVIKSMGLTGVVSAGQIGKLAMSISNKTAVDDEAVQSGQNLLLTFAGVAKSAGQANGVFSKTSQLMVDMSAAMGTDVKSSAIQLGKALNDPIKGVSALTRVGVSFTEGQKAQIKNFVETGRLGKAQGLILGEVGKQFGGAAASMATPAERAKVAWANFQEQIGGLLLPVIDKFLSTVSGKVIPAVSSFVTQIQSGTGMGGQFASVFGTISSVLGTVVGFVNQNRTAFATFLGVLAGFQILRSITMGVIAFNAALAANPIGLVVLALAGLAAGLVYAYKNSETFRNIVNGAFSAIRAVAEPVFNWLKTAVTTVISFVRDHWKLVVSIIGGPIAAVAILVVKHWDQIKAATSAVWNAIKSVIGAVWNGIKAVVSTGVAAVRGYFNLVGAIVGKVREWFGEILTAIKSKLGDAVSFVKGIPGKITAALGDLGKLLYDAGRNLIGGLINGIKSKVGDVKNAVGGVASDIKGFFGGSPVEHGPLLPWNTGEPGKVLMGFLAKGITEGGTHVTDAAGKVADAVKARFDKLRDGLKSTLDSLRSDFSSLKDSVASAFTGDLFQSTGVADFFHNVATQNNTLRNMLAAFTTLKGWGIPAQFLSQLFASGNSGLILELASDKGDAQVAAGSFNMGQTLSQQLGGQVARGEYGPRIDKISKQLDTLTRAVERQGREFGRELNNAAAHGARRR